MATTESIIGITLSRDRGQLIDLIVSNKDQLDRWCIVAMPDDRGTEEIANKHSLELLPSRVAERRKALYSSSVDEWILEGEAISRVCAQLPEGDDAWIVVVRPNVKLPSNFKSILASCTERPPCGKALGISGVRDCHSPAEFLALSGHGVWRGKRSPSDLQNAAVYIQHSSSLGRVAPQSASAEDLVCVGRALPNDIAPQLPLTCLRLSQDSKHLLQYVDHAPPDLKDTIRQLSEDLLMSAPAAPHVLVLGAEKDEFSTAASQGHRIRYSSPHAEPIRADDPPATFDAFILCGEPTTDFLLQDVLPRLSLLKPGGLILGTHYGYPWFPKATSSIELLLGTPSSKKSDSRWTLQPISEKAPAFRWPQPVPCRILCQPSVHTTEGIVLFVYGDEEAREAIAFLACLRLDWSGPITVMHWGEENEALSIAAVRFGGNYCVLEQSQRPEERERSAVLFHSSLDLPFHPKACFRKGIARILSMLASPYERTLSLTTETAIPDAPSLLALLSSENLIIPEGCQLSDYTAPITYKKHVALSICVADIREVLARPEREGVDEIAALIRAVSSFQFPAPAIRSRNVDLAQSREVAPSTLHIRIHLPPSIDVVTAVRDDDIDRLRQNWSAILWPESSRRFILPVNLPGDFPKTFLPSGAITLLSEDVNPRLSNEPDWIHALIAVLNVTKAESVLFWDPGVQALPGAQIPPEQLRDAAYVSPGWAFEFEGGGTLTKYPKLGPPLFAVNCAWLRAFLAEASLGDEALEFQLHKSAQKKGAAVRVLNFNLFGFTV